MTASIVHDEPVATAGWSDLLARWKIGGVTAAGLFLTAAGFTLSAAPLYRSQVQILLPLSAVEDPADRHNLPVAAADAFVVRSYTDVVKDRGIAEGVIAQLSLLQSKEFNASPSRWQQVVSSLKAIVSAKNAGPSLFSSEQIHLDNVLSLYSSRLKVVNEGKSLTLAISFDATDPFLARRIIDAHAQTFINFEVARRRAEATTKVSWMKTELDRQADETRAAQNAVQLHTSPSSPTFDVAADQVTDLRFRQMLAASKQTIYDAMLRRYQDMIADERYGGSGIQIISSGNLPTSPVFPQKFLMLSLAAVVSLILGLAVAWIVSIVARKQTLEEALRRLHLVKLGEVNFPRKPHRRALSRRSGLRAAVFWEQIAEIRSSMTLPETGCHILAVTSSLDKEGKSLLSAALARTFACGGNKTLLLDLNVRNPHFKLPEGYDASLQHLMAGFASLQHSVVPIDKDTPLYLLASARDVPIDVMSITGEKMRAILRQARRQFDLVIIDTPALDVVADTLLIGALADEILLVTYKSERSLAAIDEAVAKLRSRAIPMKGVVVTSAQNPASELLRRMKPYANWSRPHVVWPDTPPPGDDVPTFPRKRLRAKPSVEKTLPRVGLA